MIKFCHLGAFICPIVLVSTAEGLIGKSALMKNVVPTFQCNHQQPHHCRHSTRRRDVYTSVTATATSNDVSSARTSNKSESGECYYKRIDGSWKPRKELSNLFVGERLFAKRLPECDLLDGKTGPKLFFECGVGRKTKGNWNIVNGMLRMPGKKNMKPSVIRKKAKKIPSDFMIEVYVSKIWLDHGSFEVCLSREDALSSQKKPKVSASKLTVGEQFNGVVRDVHPYGVFVDVGASRKGLIHISKVAKMQDRYINKEEGLKKAGFSRGSPVQVVVLSNEKKRLELDLYVEEEEPIPEESLDESTTIDFKSEEDEEALAWAAYNNKSETSTLGDEEADMWAAYAAYENIDADEDDDYYDEDEEIEDALGIGSY